MRSYLVLISFVFVMLAGCTAEKPALTEAVTLSLNEAMEIDPGLSDDIDYVSLELNILEELSKSEKEKLSSHFEDTNQVNVMFANLEELKEKGLYNEEAHGLENGVLLRVEKLTKKLFGSGIVLEVEKYRSAKGAIGIEVHLEIKDGKWQVQKVENTWIS